MTAGIATWRRTSARRTNSAVLQASKRRAAAFGLLLVAPPVLLVVGLILFPILSAVVSTLRIETPDGFAVSAANYVGFFQDRQSVANLAYTLWVTVVTTILLLAACLPLALHLRFSTGRLAAIVQSVALFPLFVPAIIVCYALVRFMGPNGVIATILAQLGIAGYQTPYLTEWGPVIGLFWEGIPLTLLVLLAGLGQVSSASIEAARDVGAGPAAILFAIVIPLIRRSLLVAFALDFLSIFGSFTTPYLLGPASPEIMSTYMQRTFIDLLKPIEAQTQAVVSFAVCAIVGILYVRAVSRNRRSAGE